MYNLRGHTYKQVLHEHRERLVPQTHQFSNKFAEYCSVDGYQTTQQRKKMFISGRNKGLERLVGNVRPRNGIHIVHEIQKFH
jgi:hypothetical protein